MLAVRIEQLLQGSAPRQAELFHLGDDVGQLQEAAAERYSDLIIAKLVQPVAIATPEAEYHRININRIEAAQARSIGAETLACHAVRQLQLDQKLTALGFNKIDSAAALGSIIGRMVSPGSELQSHDWLQAFLAAQEQTLFDLNRSIVLHDLTNTYFEGQCAQNPKACPELVEVAQFGRSKEKLKCCPLVTLGLVLDGNGFPLSSQVFPGNASEPATLSLMLDGLQGKNPCASS